MLVKANTSSKESAVVQEGSDVEVDFAGHSFTAEGACAISNAGMLALNDSADRPDLVCSDGKAPCTTRAGWKFWAEPIRASMPLSTRAAR